MAGNLATFLSSADLRPWARRGALDCRVMRRSSAPLVLFALVAACGEASPPHTGDACPDGRCDALGGIDAGDGIAADAAVDECGASFPLWNDGTACPEPEVQVHALDADTFILRQSLCTSFEGPFLYLLFGEHRALLFDTGAGGVDVVAAVDAVIEDWLAARGGGSIELLVVNSHGHGDHTAGNAAFAARPDTTVVGSSFAEVVEFFHLTAWPMGNANVSLGGGREVHILPIPGHQGADVALHDQRDHRLFTGDTLYPGRLYIRDFPDYRASVHRLVDHMAGRPLCQVLGAHIEMTSTPGVDYELGASAHPAEHGLSLGRAHLEELAAALDAMADAPRVEVHDDFVITPLD